MRCDRGVRNGRFAAAVAITIALAATAPAQETLPPSQPAQSAGAQTAPAKAAKAPSKRPPTVKELQALIEEQRAQIEAQQKLIESQSASIGRQAGSIEELNKQLEQMRQNLDALAARLKEIEAQQAAGVSRADLDARLAKLEGSVNEKPEAPVDLTAAFPGSFNIPGTKTAMKIGVLVWTSVVQTFSALGSDTQFLTYSIPAQGTPEAGQGPRLSLWAAPSRFNFDVRTPTELGTMRAFIETDAAGPSKTFRLRHAYFQYGNLLVGQTWSTFSDPGADHEDIDFEGVNAENVTRQAQIRYGFVLRTGLRLAVSGEYPTASIDGGQSVNQIPDFIGRVTKDIPGGHLQGALVFRPIRGQLTDQPNVTHSSTGWGGSVSGVVPAGGTGWTKDDRVIFQVNAGKGIARYIGDLNSCDCGKDAVFDSKGNLHALQVWGFYAAYEHHWENFWNPLHLSLNNLHTSIIWGRVGVNNLSFMPATSYKKTDRISLSALWSPIKRTDVGIEYIWGERTNEGGPRGTASQLQMRGRFIF